MSPSHRCLPAFAILFSALFFFPSPAISAGRLALVIGNADYPGKLKLNCPVRDAEAVAGWLQEVGYAKSDIRLLKNASSLQMRAAMKQLVADAARLHPEQVTFYYSGHGTTVVDADGDEKLHDPKKADLTDEAFLCVFDPKGVRAKEEAMILDDEFFQFIDGLSGNVDQMVVMVDSCFSGGIFRDAQQPDGTVERLRTKFVSEGTLQQVLSESNNRLPELRSDFVSRGVVVEHGGPAELKLRGNGRMLFITAAAENQEAVDGYAGGLSEFTRHLLQVLRAEQGTSRSLEEVHAHVKKQLAQWKQDPVFMTHNLARDVPLLPELFPAKPPAALGLRWRVLSLADNRIRPVPVDHLHATGDAFLLEIESAPALWVYLLYVDPQGSGTLLELTGRSGETALQSRGDKSIRLPAGEGSRFTLTADGPPGPGVNEERFRLVASVRPLNLPADEYVKLPALKPRSSSLAGAETLAETMRLLTAANALAAEGPATGGVQLQVASPRDSQDLIVTVVGENSPPVVVDFSIRHQANKK